MRQNPCSRIHPLAACLMAGALMLLGSSPILAADPSTRVAQKSGKKSAASTEQSGSSERSSGPVVFAGASGIKLSGIYYAGRPGGQGVVLLHMDGRTQDDWRLFAEKLSRQGFHALTFDLRGHGQSTQLENGESLSADQLDQAHYGLMNKDVEAAVTFLRKETSVNGDKIALVGASLGANLALRCAADDARIYTVLMLSPGLEYKGVSAEDALQRFGDRPLFMAVSREDNFAAKSALVLDAVTTGPKRMQIYSGAGHGTRMLSREPGLEAAMTNWLNGNFSSDEDEDLPSAAPPPILRQR